MSATKKIMMKHALAFASQLLPAIVGVLSFMLLVRVAIPSVLGQYIIYMAAVILFEMVKSGGLQSALVMKVATDDAAMQKKIIGSAYWLGASFSLSVSFILVLLYFSGIFSSLPAIEIFCGWYACLGIITLPLHIAEAEAVAKQDLKFLFWFRLAQSTNGILIAAVALFFNAGLPLFATVHVCFTTLLLLMVLLSKKTNPLNIIYRTTEETKKLFQLIKYTFGTLAVTNLLKTADTFLIGSMMGPLGVAKYAVPLKLTELFEIPLRSLSTTAFPQLSANHNNTDHNAFKKTFVQYISWAYMIYIPCLLIAFVFAPFIVTVLGGQQYADTASIFRVFILFGFLLPANRMTGISLDALQLPNKNFQKVLVMAIINIVGDVAAIHFTHQLEWVAFVSVLNGALGVYIGWCMLMQTRLMQPTNIFKETTAYCKTFVMLILHRGKLVSAAN